MSTPTCNCSARHPHKGHGVDPARCPIHGSPTLCISCTVDKAEPVECMAWDDECLTCHLTRCRACQDDLADQDAAESRFDGRWS